MSRIESEKWPTVDNLVQRFKVAIQRDRKLGVKRHKYKNKTWHDTRSLLISNPDYLDHVTKDFRHRGFTLIDGEAVRMVRDVLISAEDYIEAKAEKAAAKEVEMANAPVVENTWEAPKGWGMF